MKKPVLHHAIVSTDIVLFGLTDSEQLVTVLIPVANTEYKGKLAFPGGLIQPQESARDAISRILKDKVGISIDQVYVEDLRTYSDVDRDVRGRVVSIAHIGYIRNIDSITFNDSCSVVPVTRAPRLAYDHSAMLGDAIRTLRERITTSTVIQHLLPKEFTLPQLCQTYATILDVPFDKRNFLKKLNALGILKETKKMVRTGPHRPAQLHTFKSSQVELIPLM